MQLETLAILNDLKETNKAAVNVQRLAENMRKQGLKARSVYLRGMLIGASAGLFGLANALFDVAEKLKAEIKETESTSKG
ncbi:MAG: hypothetical protein JRD89_01590 [Deltaproteobacteria bacterium]|nr:hypothetical protein [Deltaproteobacteria bacterium]